MTLISSVYFLLYYTLKERQQNAYEQGYQNAQSICNTTSQLALQKAYERGRLHGVLLSLNIDEDTNEHDADNEDDNNKEASIMKQYTNINDGSGRYHLHDYCCRD